MAPQDLATISGCLDFIRSQNRVHDYGKKLLKAEYEKCHCMDKWMALWGQASDSFIYNHSPNSLWDCYTAVYAV